MITIFNYKILSAANDGSKWELAQRRAKQSWLSQAPGDTLNTAFKPIFGFFLTDPCEERQRKARIPGSTVKSPACLWNLLRVLHPCLTQGDNLSSSCAVPRCLWHLHWRDALDFVLQEGTTTHPDFVWLPSWAEAFLVARPLTGAAPRVHWQKYL